MKKNRIIILGLALMSLLGCTKNEVITPDPATKANIIGSVNLYDDRTTEVENSGMKIIVEGITPELSTTTDANGDFTLQDVPFGTYNLTFDKTGYGTFRYLNLVHSNTGSSTIIPTTFSLGQFSTTHVTLLEVNISGNDVSILATTDPGGNSNHRRYLRFFYHTESNVSDDNYTKFSEVLISQDNPYEQILSQTDLSNLGFASGATVYIKVYGDSFWSNDYIDPNSFKRIFPNLNVNSANAVSFLVP